MRFHGVMRMDPKVILYHGTIYDFSSINVAMGKPYKDFGRGFYATAVYDHAKNIAFRNRLIEESRLERNGIRKTLPVFIYTYELNLENAGNLSVKIFDKPDKNWLKFVILNRTNDGRMHNHDIVIGPTANDNTRAALRTVTNMADGAILSDNAMDFLLVTLEPENLPTQYYFGSQEAAELLKFKRRERILWR